MGGPCRAGDLQPGLQTTGCAFTVNELKHFALQVGNRLGIVTQVKLRRSEPCSAGTLQFVSSRRAASSNMGASRWILIPRLLGEEGRLTGLCCVASVIEGLVGTTNRRKRPGWRIAVR